MAARVSITTSAEVQAKAASTLSQYLTELHCPHAYIGGFAWSLLGSERPTEDIDILIELENLDLPRLREALESKDAHFASAGIKLYFVQDPAEGLRGEELVRSSRDNVVIETLKAGTLGLPVVAEPIYVVEHFSGVSLPILSPPVLLLTKMKRWYTTYDSTRPKTVSKNKSDKEDLDFVLFWLSANGMKIDFDLYRGKTKPDLLKLVKAYRDKSRDNVALMEALQEVLHEDWAAIQVTPEAPTGSEAGLPSESMSAPSAFEPGPLLEE